MGTSNPMFRAIIHPRLSDAHADPPFRLCFEARPVDVDGRAVGEPEAEHAEPFWYLLFSPPGQDDQGISGLISDATRYPGMTRVARTDHQNVQPDQLVAKDVLGRDHAFLRAFCSVRM